ncbi:hypothetical protein Tco_0416826, partial [Tanacetum coccineum]
KAALTPMETKLPLTKDEEAFDVDVHLSRSMIGNSKDFSSQCCQEDLQTEVQASKTSKELQELADLEEAKRVHGFRGSSSSILASGEACAYWFCH